MQMILRTITDPETLEKAVETHRQELIKAYGLDKPWYTGIGDMLRRIIILDLSVCTQCTFGYGGGSSRLVM